MISCLQTGHQFTKICASILILVDHTAGCHRSLCRTSFTCHLPSIRLPSLPACSSSRYYGACIGRCLQLAARCCCSRVEAVRERALESSVGATPSVLCAVLGAMLCFERVAHVVLWMLYAPCGYRRPLTLHRPLLRARRCSLWRTSTPRSTTHSWCVSSLAQPRLACACSIAAMLVSWWLLCCELPARLLPLLFVCSVGTKVTWLFIRFALNST